MTGKLWYESKTLWVGVLQIAIAVGMALAEFLNSGVYSPEAIVLFVVGIMTIVMRYLTEEPIVPDNEPLG